MILYKYVPHEAGIKILENNTVGFSRPSDFNDPFELEAAYPSKTIPDDPIESILNGIRILAKKETWKRNTGVLSLTRQPLNSLMWAHYCDSHSGMVVGIDSSIEEFTAEKTNLIPVQYGSVLYTGIKPNSPLLSSPTEVIEVGGTFHFPYGQLERLQRMFLYKPMCWAYEEEVRVVKCLKGIETSKDIPSGSFAEIEVSGKTLYLLKLPEGAIKEVYIGTRSPILENSELAHSFIKKVKQFQPSIKAYGCSISSSSWSLESFDLEIGGPEAS